MGNYLSQPVTTKETESGSSDSLAYACSAMQGWRTDMEDAHLTLTNVGGGFEGISLFAVFDGHGGREVARFVEHWLPIEAARTGTTSDLEGSMVKLYNRMDDLLRDPTLRDELASYKARNPANGADGAQNAQALTVLQGSIQTDLQELREKKGQVSRDEATQVMMKMMFLRRLEQQMGGSSSPEAASSSAAETIAEPVNLADTAGCTAVTVLITPDSYVIANAGDSRAVLCRGGATVALSEDHKPNDEIERTRIIRAGGTIEESQGGARTHYRVNGNLNLSRAIGDLEYKKNPDIPADAQIITSTPDVRVLARSPEDEFIVIGCDGVWDVLTNEDCVQFVRQRLDEGKSLAEICEEVVDECLSPDPKATQGLGADNITCVIVDVRKK